MVVEQLAVKHPPQEEDVVVESTREHCHCQCHCSAFIAIAALNFIATFSAIVIAVFTAATSYYRLNLVEKTGWMHRLQSGHDAAQFQFAVIVDSSRRSASFAQIHLLQAVTSGTCAQPRELSRHRRRSSTWPQAPLLVRCLTRRVMVRRGRRSWVRFTAGRFSTLRTHWHLHCHMHFHCSQRFYRGLPVPIFSSLPTSRFRPIFSRARVVLRRSRPGTAPYFEPIYQRTRPVPPRCGIVARQSEHELHVPNPIHANAGRGAAKPAHANAGRGALT